MNPFVVATGVLGLALAGVLTVWVPNLYESRATERADKLAAIAANASLIDERKRAVAEAERNREISASALRETADLNSRVAAIRERLRNGTACTIDPADIDALDRLFR